MNTIKTARNILETANYACDCTNDDYTFTELKELMQEIIDNLNGNTSSSWNDENDFCIDSLACGEVRIINKGAIDEIWHDSLIEQIKDCYDLSALDDLPSFISIDIDWDQTAENCKEDGLGHHFAGYDHQEHSTDTHYIFRTN